MRITRVEVQGLFDRFHHVLEFKPEERIMIVIGPNGFGKTMILRIINALFNQPVRRLVRMPFRCVFLSFDDRSQLEVVRDNETEEVEGASRAVLQLTYEAANGEREGFTPDAGISPKELEFPVGVIEDIVPSLDQVGPALWRHRRTGETLELEDVLEQFSDELPPVQSELPIGTPDWLKRIRESIPVRFIDTERLTHPLPQAPRRIRSRPYTARMATERTVRRYSEELSQRVKQTLTEYGSLSQSLDRTFPVRVVEEPERSDLPLDELRKDLATVEEKRKRLVGAGLLAQEHESWGVPTLDIDRVDESKRGVLAVYASDARQKLSVFDDLYERVDTLTRIANSRFIHKTVSIGPEGIRVCTSGGSELELEMLSSGEQHELVILYDLLFRVSPGSLILIDEPELSLHVTWQEAFLQDLENMAELSNFRAILATHSPQIIGDRWDLTVELAGPDY